MGKWNGKRKALTFSFDDATEEDRQVVSILNQYGLKGTFNINSGLLGTEDVLFRGKKIPPYEVKDLYAGHEVAVHTLVHADLPNLDRETIIWHVERDRELLEQLVGYEIVGMAYPGGGRNNDDRVASIIREDTKIQYARTIEFTRNFDMQDNLYRFNPTVDFSAEDELLELGKKFLEADDSKPRLFYVFGHAYGLRYTGEKKFREFCEMLSGRDDIFYGTNREVLL